MGKITKFETFKKHIVKNILSYCPEELRDYQVVTCQTRKNNDLILTGITLSSNERPCGPTTYLEPLFELYTAGNMTLKECCAQIAKVLSPVAKVDNDAVADRICEIFDDFSKAEPLIMPRLVSSEQDLSNQPYYTVCEGLAVTFYLDFDYIKELGRGGMVSLLTERMERWSVVSADKLFEIAMRNYHNKTHAVLVDMTEQLEETLKMQIRMEFETSDEVEVEMYFNALKEQMRAEAYKNCLAQGMPEDVADEASRCFFDSPFDIITNTQETYGALSILDQGFMDSLCDRYKTSELILIPSTLDEVMVANNSEELSMPELVQAVRYANRTEGNPDMILSYKIFKYDSATKKISVKEVA